MEAWRQAVADVVVGQSYYLRFDPKLWEAMQPYPPLGALYAASLLREHGFNVALFDAMLAESETRWAEALDRHKPPFAVIFEDNFNYLSKMCLSRMREAAFTMIRMGKAAGCTVIVGGSDATDHAEQYLGAGADFVLLGEGEMTLVELLEKLAGRAQTAFDDIAGLAYFDQGEVKITRARPNLRDPDNLPFPAWDLVDVDRYRRVWHDRHGYYSMNMVTTRGCPYHCNWCAKPIWGQRYVSRGPQSVVAEMKWLKQTYHPDHLWFADDIMGLKPGWWEQFADLVESQEASIPFKCLCRADLIARSPASVDALRRAGCQIVWIGAESGSQKVLDAMDKGIAVGQIREASRLLHQRGIQVGFFLQFGYPGETRRDVEATLRLVRDCHPDDIGMSVSYPLPGTRFYESVRLELGHKQNWVDSSDLEMLYHGPFSTAFYRQLHLVLHTEFRAYRALRRLLAVLFKPGQWRLRLARDALLGLVRAFRLPLLWVKLDTLARLPHQGIGPLPHLTLEEAAHPTEQVE